MRIIEIVESIESRNRYRDFDQILTSMLAQCRSMNKLISLRRGKLDPNTKNLLTRHTIKLENTFNETLSLYKETASNIEGFESDSAFVRTEIRNIRLTLALL